VFEHASLLAKVREPSNGEHSYGEGATSPRSGIVMESNIGSHGRGEGYGAASCITVESEVLNSR